MGGFRMISDQQLENRRGSNDGIHGGDNSEIERHETGGRVKEKPVHKRKVETN